MVIEVYQNDDPNKNDDNTKKIIIALIVIKKYSLSCRLKFKV